MPTKWYWVIHGRLTSERKAYTSRSSFINHSTIAWPAARSSAQTPSLSNTWTLDRLRTRRRIGSTRRRGNHMHDHSRFQRDIDWRHRRLSLFLSQKSLTHNIGSASALPIIHDVTHTSAKLQACEKRKPDTLWLASSSEQSKRFKQPGTDPNPADRSASA